MEMPDLLACNLVPSCATAYSPLEGFGRLAGLEYEGHSQCLRRVAANQRCRRNLRCAERNCLSTVLARSPGMPLSEHLLPSGLPRALVISDSTSGRLFRLFPHASAVYAGMC